MLDMNKAKAKTREGMLYLLWVLLDQGPFPGRVAWYKKAGLKKDGKRAYLDQYVKALVSIGLVSPHDRGQVVRITPEGQKYLEANKELIPAGLPRPEPRVRKSSSPRSTMVKVKDAPSDLSLIGQALVTIITKLDALTVPQKPVKVTAEQKDLQKQLKATETALAASERNLKNVMGKLKEAQDENVKLRDSLQNSGEVRFQEMLSEQDRKKLQSFVR